MKRSQASRALALLTLTVVSVTIGLHQLGTVEAYRIDWSNPLGWLQAAEPTDALAAVFRYVGLAIGYWTVTGTLLYALAARRHTPRTSFRWLALPGIRRLVDTALATALTASLAAVPLQPALAAEQPPAVFDINDDGIPVPHVRLEVGATKAEVEVVDLEAPPPAAEVTGSAVPVTVPPDGSSTEQAGSYTVQSGDNLWLIAEKHLATEQGADPAAATLSAYWRHLVSANQPTLRSGDPNLIYPGEIIILPAIEATQ